MSSRASLALAFALAAGCAAAPEPATRESTSPNPRAELAQLEARIGFLREQLRLPSTPPVGVSSGTPGYQRCRDVTAAADEICRAAVRICALAEVIGEDDARRSCTQAREDCRRARGSADECK